MALPGSYLPERPCLAYSLTYAALPERGTGLRERAPSSMNQMDSLAASYVAPVLQAGEQIRR